MSRKLIIFLAVLGVVYYWQQGSNFVLDLAQMPKFALRYHDDLAIESPPIQEQVSESIKPFTIGEYQFTPLAEFQAAVRVLGAKHYGRTREDSLSPVDLALGWGPMAKQEVLDAISIRQSGRFYYWQTENFPIPRDQIETHSANMHFIPTSPEIETRLRQVRENEFIRFKGYLVRIDANDGWRWISSTTRNDTGRGACELVLIDDIARL